MAPGDFFGVPMVLVTFDAPANGRFLPQWLPDAGDIVGIGEFGPISPEQWGLFIDGAMPTQITIALSLNAFQSYTGGNVVPGVYPVV